ncbi:KH domain-containing protein [Cyclospora cayetanensis]|uniref:KH domain-containing protein n=1 Tax=Cyclospora cayetanensis TaxID=88456 RepID=A0A1D3D604_9EIME|nr:KH domain-containing protein [Cyclospora cayetanensis]
MGDIAPAPEPRTLIEGSGSGSESTHQQPQEESASTSQPAVTSSTLPLNPRKALPLAVLGSPSGEEGNCYCKILVTNQLAGIIIGQAGHEIRTLKNITGAKIVLSPHGMYFPGTTERIAAVEGPEQAVFHVLDWILEKMAAVEALSVFPDPAASQPTVPPPLPYAHNSHLQQQQLPQLLPLWAPRSSSVRICVPRAVVGSLIGKNGGYIQSLRVATGASINISPLFVTAEEACAERIVSVESRRRPSLKTAAFTLIRKINEHPERSSCRHVCYFRKHSFDSPLAEPLVASAAAAASGAAKPLSDFKFVRQQHQHDEQLQQLQRQLEQHQSEASRRRTVSLVMGSARPSALLNMKDLVVLDGTNNCGNSSAQSSGIGTASGAEEHFASAFKRFCEARAATTKPEEACAPAGGGSPWDLSRCSTAIGSSDRLPPITEDISTGTTPVTNGKDPTQHQAVASQHAQQDVEQETRKFEQHELEKGLQQELREELQQELQQELKQEQNLHEEQQQQRKSTLLLLRSSWLLVHLPPLPYVDAT